MRQGYVSTDAGQGEMLASGASASLYKSEATLTQHRAAYLTQLPSWRFRWCAQC